MTDGGALRHLVTIEAPTDSFGAGNAVVQVWTTFAANVRALVRPFESGELLRSQQISGQVTHVVELRYRAGIKATMRVRYMGRILNLIAPPIDRNERHEWMQLLCREEEQA